MFKAQDVYCPCGKFVPSEMLTRLSGCYDQAIIAGYPGARVSGEMSWALKGIPGSERLMEYEALINTLCDKHPVTPICQYDARRFDGATLLNVLKVHPMMIVQGKIVQNPYFIEPQEFLRDFVPGQ
ncbi:MAG: MEDS domain-containing protein [Candidatus Methanoperedens sp.]|nr:MEDS domain-containing protein [Candidatus Methanoperedens sp.]